ncbi:hypothetical protein P4V72_29685 [Bacillus thuringiensis]|uniref:Uncharacterized protein n=1 Tax=Bacillus thuringiensis TaxID=1428 RepID=A0A9W3TG48_BACTU|nr:hypothetical protein [Bacillus thuringiensis]MEB9098406.1 hypothetical protein [Bacillus cereus]AQY40934.1 hypothetical protein B4918_24555 [Bacillus thuringiensis]MDR4149478.1 hypothetical protein [Bacillus thuringiensis]MEC3575240.1 hypothetical protein [Bacillus thuringiensis]MED2021731.1 hypothetical protein [Bacillus thuringiensis]
MDTKTVVTIICSFMAAGLAQMASHLFTLRRETKNYQKACYQNLYSPTIFKLTDYIKSEGHSKEFYEHHNSYQNPTEIFNEIMQHVEKNLNYTSVDIINFYQVWKRDFSRSHKNKELHDYVKFENEMDLRITFANTFFSKFIKLNKSLKFKHKIVDEELKVPYFFTHFFLLIKECTRPYSITYAEIFGMYNLIEDMLLTTNNYTERIITIRNDLDKVPSTTLYKNEKRVHKAYISANKFLYEIANDLAAFSEVHSNDFKEFLNSSIQR